MEDDGVDIIRDIRKRCRMAMDGVISSTMRSHGLDYKLNFGVPILKIKEIASRYIPNAVLAEKLWKDTTRELKILATHLYPKEEFTIDVARRWVKEIPNQEIREQLSFNLFRDLPYTYAFGIECANNEDEDIRTTSYWFLARHIIEYEFEEEIDYDKMPYIWSDLEEGNTSSQNAVKLLLKNIGRISIEKAKTILWKIISFKESEDPLKREVFHSLMFDYQFHHGNAIKQIEFV